MGLFTFHAGLFGRISSSTRWSKPSNRARSCPEGKRGDGSQRNRWATPWVGVRSLPSIDYDWISCFVAKQLVSLFCIYDRSTWPRELGAQVIHQVRHWLLWKAGQRTVVQELWFKVRHVPSFACWKNKVGNMQGSRCSIPYVLFSSKLGWGVPDIDSYNYFHHLW